MIKYGRKRRCHIIERLIFYTLGKVIGSLVHSSIPYRQCPETTSGINSHEAQRTVFTLAPGPAQSLKDSEYRNPIHDVPTGGEWSDIGRKKEEDIFG